MKKSLKAIVAAASAVIMCAAPAAAVFATLPATSLTASAADDTAVIGNLKYSLNASTKKATLIGVNYMPLQNMTVPATFTWHGITYKVTSIKDSAFRGNTYLKTVDLSSAIYLTDLGRYTFMECSKLESVKLGPAVNQMGNCDFSECPKLKNFQFVTSHLDEIAPYAFRNDTALKNIDIPYSVKEIWSDAFLNTGLTEIKISNNVDYIGLSAFQNCQYLTKVTFEAGTSNLLDIRFRAFGYCPNLTTVQCDRAAIDDVYFGFQGSTNAHFYGPGASHIHS